MAATITPQTPALFYVLPGGVPAIACGPDGYVGGPGLNWVSTAAAGIAASASPIALGQFNALFVDALPSPGPQLPSIPGVWLRPGDVCDSGTFAPAIAFAGRD